MTEDNRDGRDPRTGTVPYSAAASGTAQPLLAPRGEVVVSLSDLIVTYSSSATVEATVELYDAPPTTNAGNLSTPFFNIHAEPGDTIDLIGCDFKDVVAGLVVVVQNNDGQVLLNANGVDITG